MTGRNIFFIEKSRHKLIRLRTKVRRALKSGLPWMKIRQTVKTLLNHPDDDPDAPFAMVTAPTKPRPPRRSGAVAVDPQDY